MTLLPSLVLIVSQPPFITKHNPFAESTKLVNTPLAHFSLNTLKVKGVAWQENHYWVAIQTPLKQIYWVQSGAVIGNQQGKIIKIKPNGIIVCQHQQLIQITM